MVTWTKGAYGVAGRSRPIRGAQCIIPTDARNRNICLPMLIFDYGGTGAFWAVARANSEAAAAPDKNPHSRARFVMLLGRTASMLPPAESVPVPSPGAYMTLRKVI